MHPVMNRVKSLGLVALVASASAAVDAQVTVDFENFNLGGQLYLDTLEMVVISNVGGSGVNVTIQAYDDLRIYDMFQYGGAGTQAMIDMNWNNFNNPLGTDILFDPVVSNVSLLAGDFGSDDDSPLMIVAYDAAGNVLGTASQPWPASASPPLAVLSVNACGIKRIHYSSGGTFQNSTFVDDITFMPSGSARHFLPFCGTVHPGGTITLPIIADGGDGSKTRVPSIPLVLLATRPNALEHDWTSAGRLRVDPRSVLGLFPGTQIRIPDDPRFIGQTLYAQSLLVDSRGMYSPMLLLGPALGVRVESRAPAGGSGGWLLGPGQ